MEEIKEKKELLTIKPCGCMERDGILYLCSQYAVSRIVKGQLDEERQIVKSWRPESKRGQGL